MVKDKYTAVWVSHSSISDYLKCPRAYFLNNIYKDPRTGHKINLMSPPLALGQAIHQVLESLSILPVEKRFTESLAVKFDEAFLKISGKRGGFFDQDTEEKYKQQGREMIKRVINHPGPLAELAVKINMELPFYWLAEEENIILCGKIDWLKFIKEKEAVEIIDFKTGKTDEDPGSLQLLIYCLLATNCQSRKIEGVSYWYLERLNKPTPQPLPNLIKAEEKILKIAKKIKLARQLMRFKCPHKNGCRACKPLEAVVRGEAEFVGTDEYNQDVYVLNNEYLKQKPESIVL